MGDYIRYAERHGTSRPWLVHLMARRTTKVAAVALANKTARMVWALMPMVYAVEDGRRGILLSSFSSRNCSRSSMASSIAPKSSSSAPCFSRNAKTASRRSRCSRRPCSASISPMVTSVLFIVRPPTRSSHLRSLRRTSFFPTFSSEFCRDDRRQ
ncbi:hypothetical protein DY251_16575 [Mesorhizobium denitrificans]|uniref:Transposase n=1 Tax=Mesorhizobium denitrificans TaxID=2294114 RepID=A0A371X8V1_9HYPH|nr:hypothetical protein DY251_16575 [Mesorhizobium denitrificans]